MHCRKDKNGSDVMVKKSRLILFLVLFVLSFAGCSQKSDYEEQLPEIVFICITDNSEISKEIEIQYSFVDKNGNQYVTSDPVVTELGIEKFIEKYSKGDLDGKIELLKNFDSSLIEDNYKKIRKAALNEDVSLKNHDYYLDVQSVCIRWYGIIYGNDGNLEIITLHEQHSGDTYSKSDSVNSIYEWYIETFGKSNSPEVVDNEK